MMTILLLLVCIILLPIALLALLRMWPLVLMGLAAFIVLFVVWFVVASYKSPADQAEAAKMNALLQSQPHQQPSVQ